MRRTIWVAGGGLAVLGTAAVVASGQLDATPPTITIQAPDHPVRGAVPLTITVSDLEPGGASATLQLDGRAPVPLSLDADGRAVWTAPEDPHHDGEHSVTVTATDRAWTANTAQATARFTTDHTPPTLQVAQVPSAPRQGQVAAVFVRATEALVDPRVAALDQQRSLSPVQAGIWRALIGVGVAATHGEQTWQVSAADTLGNRVQCSISVVVHKTDFPRGGTIRLSKKQTKARTDTEALAKMRADRNAAYTFIDPESYWDTGGETSVLRPIPGRRTSAFGRYRTYSDGRKKHHLGTDLASPTGTPVHAALGGIVRAAGWQHLFGNAVIVHHGQGLTTSYNHLSALSVALGDPVARGQEVGAVGSTGQSTGPHLHWGMQVGEVEVDPEQWPAHGFADPDLLDGLPWALASDCHRVE